MKTVYFQETIVSGYSNMGIFFAVAVAMVAMTPCNVFLKMPWVNKHLASCDFTYTGLEKRPLRRNTGNSEAGGTSFTPFASVSY
jgi:hypothetical protein